MGTSTPLEFAGKMAAAATFAPGIAKQATEDAAKITKRVILANTPDHLRNVGKNGRLLGVRYTVGEYPDGGKALVYATGPFQLIERDTKPHPIPRLSGSRASKKTGETKQFGPAFGGLNARHKPVLTPFGPKAVVFHPGTQGKHPFARGVAEASALNRIAYATELHTRLSSLF